ncbi:hypothetical protein [Calothrix sp. UHCC 0171]|uniref:hypothetical protein n=1 Tax=Calothrix sp. UHCC 0171 TaxID=3110245 RepID=UPI002B20432F|nr:hypothetical protein [Calothrix sp. UHCC 0171]MEA5570465.1 hypothetical protein [Calothrix sp. UHCC 0171]
MTSCDKNNALEVDEICFETLLSEPEYQLPENGEEIGIKLGFRITNKSDKSYRFHLPLFVPELSDHNRNILAVDAGRNMTVPVKESDIEFIAPGQSVDLYIRAELTHYINYGVHLRAYADYGAIYSFRNLQPDEYNIRFKYRSPRSKHRFGRELKYREYDGFWVGEVYTPWKRLSLKEISRK